MVDTVIECGNTLGIADVGDLYAKLLTELAEGNSVRFNVSEIERIDTAALQVMCSYSKEVISHGQSLVWQSPSEAFLRSVRLLGLESRMNIEDNTDG
ncbi:MAG: hypothetical protein COA90_00295 [Gammaproteobacteria bacterium]|nr:MAG: hypothetical protein COA90_00295 [Gammaproteobacteria bacterium]